MQSMYVAARRNIKKPVPRHEVGAVSRLSKADSTGTCDQKRSRRSIPDESPPGSPTLLGRQKSCSHLLREAPIPRGRSNSARAIDGPSSRYAMPGRCRWAMPGHRTSWSTPPQSNGWGDGTRQSLKKQSLKKPLLTKQSLNKTQRGGLVRREGSCRRIRDKAVGAERDRLTPGGVIGRESRARHQPLIPKVCWRITSRAGLLAHRACGEDEPKSVDRSHECISRALHPPPCAFPCRSNDLHSDARLRGMRAHRPVYSCGYSPSFDSPDAAEPMCRKHIGAQR